MFKSSGSFLWLKFISLTLFSKWLLCFLYVAFSFCPLECCCTTTSASVIDYQLNIQARLLQRNCTQTESNPGICKLFSDEMMIETPQLAKCERLTPYDYLVFVRIHGPSLHKELLKTQSTFWAILGCLCLTWLLQSPSQVLNCTKEKKQSGGSMF